MKVPKAHLVQLILKPRGIPPPSACSAQAHIIKAELLNHDAIGMVDVQSSIVMNRNLRGIPPLFAIIITNCLGKKRDKYVDSKTKAL